MALRPFAPWVEPFAGDLRRTRAEIADFAGSAPAGFWDSPSPNDGWSNKDLLAHLATSHWVLQSLLRLAIDGVPFEFSGPDAGNAERVAERRSLSVPDLIAEVEAEGEETQALLQRITPEHADFRRAGAPRTLAETLAGFVNHDPYHLNQLRAGLEANAYV